MAPNKRTTIATPATVTTPTITITNAQLQALIDRGVAATLAERDTDMSMNGDNNNDSGTGGRRQMTTPRECSYTDFLKCQPMSFQGTEGVNSHMRAVGQDVAYAIPWVALKRTITDKYYPRESAKVEKYIDGLPDMIHGSVKASKPQSMQEAIEFATKTMDKKMLTHAERHYKSDCPKLKNVNQGNRARNGNVMARAYVVGTAETNPNSNVVTGTFLLNNHYASILFDTGADRSFVSTSFSSLIDIISTTLDHGYDVELADDRFPLLSERDIPAEEVCTADEVKKMRNDVKARTTLLLALPDEHQLRFSKYKTAQELWAAILKTFGSETLEQTFNRVQAIVSHLEFINVEIEQDDLNQKFLTSLAPEWLTYMIVWKNRSDLDTMSLDDLYNHLKVYEPEVQKKSESNSHNMAFISSAKNNSGKEEVNTASPIFTIASVVTPYSRRKGKEKMVESDTPKKKKLQEQIDEYEQFAADLSIGEKTDMINELVIYQDHYAKVLKYQSQQRKPLSKKQQREFYMSVLKSHSGWKTKHFKGMTLDEIREKFILVWKQIEDFVPMASKEEGERFKRKGLRLEQDSAKKIKTLEELSKEDLKAMMQLVPVEEVYVEALQGLPIKEGSYNSDDKQQTSGGKLLTNG
nr:ribonuclease H-like domain-containing protein [Tanacetum cinerariifolium]